jgi:enoyl-CoA hydratase/carnithine racemase
MGSDSGTDQPVLYEKDGAVVTVTLNQPETRNALTGGALLDALGVALERVNADRGVAVMILAANGPAFSSGGNLKHMAERTDMFAGTSNDVRERYRSGIQRVAKLLWGLEVPTICAVNGPAYGAGCDFTMMCDIRIASERARFAENFVKIGLIPGDGGGWLLPRVAGLSRAAEMTFTGEPVDAATALAWGLVSRVVPPDELPAAARALAGRIADNSIPALRMAKRLMREGLHTRFDALLEMAAAMQAVAHETPEYDARVKAAWAKVGGG